MRIPTKHEILRRLADYKRLRVDSLIDYEINNMRGLAYESTVLSAVQAMSDFVIEHQELPPTEALALFVKECERCSLEDTSPTKIFSVYTDVGRDVIDFVGRGEEWYWHVCF